MSSINQVSLGSTAGTRAYLPAAKSKLSCWVAQTPAGGQRRKDLSRICPVPFARLLREEDGQDLLEYAFIVALIGLGALASVSGMAGKLHNALAALGNAVTSAT